MPACHTVHNDKGQGVVSCRGLDKGDKAAGDEKTVWEEYGRFFYPKIH